MLRALSQPYLPNKVVLLRPLGESPEIVTIAPFTAAQRALKGKATAYVCRDFTCKAPVTSVAEMLALLNGTAASPR
jgi:hypothetical protein